MAKDELPIVQTRCARDTVSCNLVAKDGVRIYGTPRSGRIDEHDELSDNEKTNRKIWTDCILNAISVPKAPCKDECYLHVTFYLDEDRYDQEKSLDLDNLLKPLMDTLGKNRLVEDDKLFSYIRAQKVPVINRNKPHLNREEGVKFRCITARTLTIDAVEELPGCKLVPGWKSPMQLITATDEQNGEQGLFIDHLPGVFLRDEYERRKYYHDIIPGYEWKEGETVRGCIVQRRQHHIRQPDRTKTEKQVVHCWLHKWPD